MLVWAFLMKLRWQLQLAFALSAILFTQWVIPGSDAASLRSRARRDGEEYVLDGNKVFITNGTEADLALVFATVDPEAGHRGITAFAVDLDCPGSSRGGHEVKLGVNASGTTELARRRLT